VRHGHPIMKRTADVRVIIFVVESAQHSSVGTISKHIPSSFTAHLLWAGQALGEATLRIGTHHTCRALQTTARLLQLQLT
jgi:hypothetical protein